VALAHGRDELEATSLLGAVTQLAVAVGQLDAARVGFEARPHPAAWLELGERCESGREADHVHTNLAPARSEPVLEQRVRPQREQLRPRQQRRERTVDGGAFIIGATDAGERPYMRQAGGQRLWRLVPGQRPTE